MRRVREARAISGSAVSVDSGGRDDGAGATHGDDDLAVSMSTPHGMLAADDFAPSPGGAGHIRQRGVGR